MTWCKDNREKAAMYALRGYNTFSNELEEVENILEIYPESPYIKLLAIRYINKMERNVLTRYNHSNATDDTSSFMQPSGKVLAEYERGQKVIKAVMNHPKVSDKDFWALYLAHLSFLAKTTTSIRTHRLRPNHETRIAETKKPYTIQPLSGTTEVYRYRRRKNDPPIPANE